MKKFFLTLSVVLIAAAAVADTTTTLLDLDFEDCALGAALGQKGMVASTDTQWGSVATAGATIEDFAGNKVLKVTQVGGGQEGIAIPLDDSAIELVPGNYLRISFKRWQNTGHYYGEMRLLAKYENISTTGSTRPVMNFENNGTTLHFLAMGYDLSPDKQAGETTSYTGAVTEETWQEFLFEIDLATGLLDFYIDGARQVNSTYQMSIRRCDGFKYLIFANGTGGASTTRPGVLYDDVKVEYFEISKKLVRTIDFDDFAVGKSLNQIAPSWLTQQQGGGDCYITNIAFNTTQNSLFLPRTASSGFAIDIDADNYQGCTYAVEFGYAYHSLDGYFCFNIKNASDRTFWRFWDNWHWKTAFTVDGTANTEKQYGPDGPMNNWCLNTFVFNQDSTLYRTGRIDTGNMGHRYRSTGGYDFYNSPDHTFGYTDADASGTVNSVAFYHGWWNGDVDICVSHINVYVLGVPEPGFLAILAALALAFARRQR